MYERDFWLNVLQRLQPTIKRAPFITWFQHTTAVEVKGSVLIIGVPSTYAQQNIEQKYKVKILQAAQELNEAIESLDFQVDGRFKDELKSKTVDVAKMNDEKMAKKVRKVRNMNEVKVTVGKSGEKIASRMLNDRYTLDNFVVGYKNKLPHAASTAVVNMPGGIYNPFYIYGTVGLGKTHLLQAIGSSILNIHPDLVVKYTTSERFVSEVVSYIAKRQMQKFKQIYRNVDVFLIDDIQFLGNKESSQREFFHTFNELYDMNKQIVMTSDRPPSELDDLDKRLTDRFGMGMVVELQMPDFETRLAILNQKCKEFEAIIDPEVLSFISSNVSTSVRELEGVLKQLICQMQIESSVATIRMAAEIIKRMNRAQKIIGFDINERDKVRSVKTCFDVMNIVAAYFDLTVEDLVGKARNREVMVPRQICMYLIKNELGDSYEKIGDGFGGRNHTTVMHACSKVRTQLNTDLRLVRDINSIKREMGL
jgi:chromosomal replication initiator protein